MAQAAAAHPPCSAPPSPVPGVASPHFPSEAGHRDPQPGTCRGARWLLLLPPVPAGSPPEPHGVGGCVAGACPPPWGMALTQRSPSWWAFPKGGVLGLLVIKGMFFVRGWRWGAWGKPAPGSSPPQSPQLRLVQTPAPQPAARAPPAPPYPLSSAGAAACPRQLRPPGSHDRPWTCRHVGKHEESSRCPIAGEASYASGLCSGKRVGFASGGTTRASAHAQRRLRRAVPGKTRSPVSAQARCRLPGGRRAGVGWCGALRGGRRQGVPLRAGAAHRAHRQRGVSHRHPPAAPAARSASSGAGGCSAPPAPSPRAAAALLLSSPQLCREKPLGRAGPCPRTSVSSARGCAAHAADAGSSVRGSAQAAQRHQRCRGSAQGRGSRFGSWECHGWEAMLSRSCSPALLNLGSPVAEKPAAVACRWGAGTGGTVKCAAAAAKEPWHACPCSQPSCCAGPRACECFATAG